MKILMIAPQPIFEPRGTPISVYQRLQALSVLRYQVDLLTYPIGQDVSIPGVTVYRGPHVPFIRKVKLGPSWAKALLDILLICQTIVLLSKNKYDAIHSHEEAAFWSALLSRVFHTRHVYDMHSCLPQQLASVPGWNWRPFVKLFAMLEGWVINSCDAVITIGVDLEHHVKGINPEAKTVFIQNLPLTDDDAGSCRTVANELKKKMGLDNKLTVVYTGSFEGYQGLDLLLKSAKIVKEHHVDVLFIMVGGNPQQVEHWQNQASICGLGDSILFTGTVPLAEAIAYLDVANILVSPRTEGMSVPLKIYSYLHSGKPIVATDVVAHSQVLSAEVAVLAAPKEEAFADGILTLARSPDLRKRLGLRGQQLARQMFDPADYLAKVDQVYRELDVSVPPREREGRSLQAGQPQPSQERWLRLP